MQRSAKYKRAIEVGDTFDLIEARNAKIVAIVAHKDVKNDILVYGDNSPDTKVVVYCYTDCNKRPRYTAMPLGSFCYSAVLKWEADHIKPFSKKDRETFFNKNGLIYG